VTAFQAAIKSGNKPADQEMLGVSEMLMRQLLKLDSIEADGDAKALRRTEVCPIPGRRWPEVSASVSIGI